MTFVEFDLNFLLLYYFKRSCSLFDANYY